MNKTKIEWCDSTWNPVTGCLHSCEYCYARKIANRFGTIGKTIETAAKGRIVLDDAYFRNPDHFSELNEPVRDDTGKIEPYPANFYPTLHRYRLVEPVRKTKPQTIFVCSMADLFGEWVPDTWIEEVFAACEKAPQHRFLFLTKNPKRYLELADKGALPRRENMWYGTTVTTNETPFFYGQGYNTFLSIEPILEKFPPLERPSSCGISWIIVGAETGNRKDKVIPEKSWIDIICKSADKAKAAVFMKESLVPIAGEENMRREFPWERSV